jgi:hypothetical protein
MNRTRVAALVAATILAGAVLMPAFAEDYYDVILANQLVCRLRDPGGFGSVSERGCRVEQNVVEALSVEDVGHPRMWVKAEGGVPSLYIGKTFLLQVRAGDAAGTGRSVSSLARTWLVAFQQQFPRAEPVTKQGASGAGASLGAVTGPVPSAPLVVPDVDRALVASVEQVLADVRAMDAACFQAQEAGVATQVAELVWAKSRNRCEGALKDVAGADKALGSALNGIKYARELAPESYTKQKTLVAVTVVKRVRTAVGSSMPDTPPAMPSVPSTASATAGG